MRISAHLSSQNLSPITHEGASVNKPKLVPTRCSRRLQFKDIATQPVDDKGKQLVHFVTGVDRIIGYGHGSFSYQNSPTDLTKF